MTESDAPQPTEPKPLTKASLLSVRGIVDVLASLLGLATLAGFIGRWWWLPDLCSHFRVQYLVASLGLALYFGLRRESLRTGLMMGCTLINLLVLQNHLISGDPAPMGRNPNRVAIVWWNIQSQSGDPEAFLKWIDEVSPDVIALGEVTPAWEPTLASLSSTYPYQEIHARTDNFGIALLSRHLLFNPTVIPHTRFDLPTIRTEMLLSGKAVTFFATHPVPPLGFQATKARNQQLSDLATQIRTEKNATILIGDLNTTPWNHAFRALCKDSGLVPAQTGIASTWPARFFPLRIPLDHCLHSPRLKVVAYDVGPHLKSDHHAIHCTLGW